MARHTITLEEMTEHLNQDGWHNAASCHGRGSHKCLEVSTRGIFRVTTHGKVTYQGVDLGTAVFAYNEAP